MCYRDSRNNETTVTSTVSIVNVYLNFKVKLINDELDQNNRLNLTF